MQAQYVMNCMCGSIRIGTTIVVIWTMEKNLTSWYSGAVFDSGRSFGLNHGWPFGHFVPSMNCFGEYSPAIAKKANRPAESALAVVGSMRLGIEEATMAAARERACEMVRARGAKMNCWARAPRSPTRCCADGGAAEGEYGGSRACAPRPRRRARVERARARARSHGRRDRRHLN